jgi:phospholipid/cholesterol/gamma-HCH transport system substrate-binding protein
VRRSWAAVTVGALVLVVATLSYFLIHWTNERMSGSVGYTVYGIFRDASGLFEKSRVQTAGISVGEIESRELDQTTAHAKIVIRMRPNIKLYENAVVSKKSASLLGEYYLEIDPGTPIALVNGERKEMKLLREGDQIKNVREPTAMGDLIDDVGTLLPILRDILNDVHRLTSGTITDIATNVNELIEKNSAVLERLLQRVDHIAANVDEVTSTERDDVKVAIKNVREITEGLKGLVGSSEGEVKQTGTAMRSTLDRLQSSVTNLDKTLKNLEQITTRVDQGQGTIGHLLNDETTANNIEQITEDAGTLVRSVTQLQTIVGLRLEYNLLSRDFKSYLAVRLVPRPDKFYLIELVEDPRGFRDQVSTVTNSSITGPSSQTTVTTTRQLRFTLMFGKRYGAVAGRFGIEESTGGLGGDLYLFNDRLTLSIDVFDTLANKYPRVKPALALAVWKHNGYLVGGADDVLNLNRATGGAGGGFDWFVGGQLVFNDEDLKSLLLFGFGSTASASASK